MRSERERRKKLLANWRKKFFQLASKEFPVGQQYARG